MPVLGVHSPPEGPVLGLAVPEHPPPQPGPICNCGQPATANGRECQRCWLGRLRSVSVNYAPTRNSGRGRMMGKTANERWDRRLDRYARARKEGIQPEGTSTEKVDKALRLSDERQEAFRADRAALEMEGRVA